MTVNNTTVEYICQECNTLNTQIPINGQVECSHCYTINDIWLDGDLVPLRHEKLNTAYHLSAKSNTLVDADMTKEAMRIR